MSDFEFNKILAAVLVAGILAMLSYFIASKFVHPEHLHEDVVAIEGGAVASSGPKKAAMPDPVLHLIASADIAKGEKLSRACAACHSFESGGPHKVGPNIYNIVGGPKAAKSGFSYSDVLAEMDGKWSYANLNRFLWKPKKYAPGTKMNFIGLKKPEDRAAMIAWLRTLSSSPAPLPSDADIAAEKTALGLDEAPEPESGAEAPADVEPHAGDEEQQEEDAGLENLVFVPDGEGFGEDATQSAESEK